jgi:uncharacterized HhH-GPD family protein
MKPVPRLPIEPVSDSATAFAFLLGVLFNQRMRAEDAWRAPHRLGKRIGGITPAHITAMPLSDFGECFGRPPAVHCFKRAMAERAYHAAELVEARYSGDARRIWENTTAKQFVARLMEFDGIGQHKARVALFVATRELGIHIRSDGHSYSVLTCGSLAALFHPHHEPLLT